MPLLPLLVISRLDQAAALLEPTRVRILRELREPDSASGLARRLGLPRQRANYHLRELETAGLVRLVREQKKGNCTERVVQAVARAFVLSPEILGEVSPSEACTDRYSPESLIAAAARAIREVSAQGNRPVATLATETDIRFATPADERAFAEDLVSEVAKLAAEYDDPGASRSFRIVVGGYPCERK
ncbi:hypothetical protein PHYC_03874 [Phycisphaerales bacterium]|nr:hypothetical protein PHYC_03874 [Phycisphaerales bacterium]